MSGQNELLRLLGKAEVRPFRRVGKLRAEYRRGTPNETLQAAFAALKQFAGADVWPDLPELPEPERAALGVMVADVCDDPAPKDVDPATCPVTWLVERAARYHLRIIAVPPDGIGFDGADGWRLRDVTPLLPAWYTAVCRDRRAEIVAHVNAAHARQTAPDPEEESCRLCGADVSDPELRARLADPAFCDRGGAKAVTNKLTGEPIHAAEPRCPYKPPRA